MRILQEFFLKYIQIFADINLIGSIPLRLPVDKTIRTWYDFSVASLFADMVKLAYTMDLGSIAFSVQVQVLLSAPY